MATTLYLNIDQASDKIRSEGVKHDVQMLIVNAADNANVTIDIEHAAPASDWDAIFVGSLQSLLSDRWTRQAHNFRYVEAFFAKHGIRA